MPYLILLVLLISFTCITQTVRVKTQANYGEKAMVKKFLPNQIISTTLLKSNWLAASSWTWTNEVDDHGQAI